MSDMRPETRAFLEARRQAPGLSEAKRAALKSSVLGHLANGTAPLGAAGVAGAAGALGKGTIALIGLASIAIVAAGGAAVWSRASTATAPAPQGSSAPATTVAALPAPPSASIIDPPPASPPPLPPESAPSAPDAPARVDARSGRVKTAPRPSPAATTTATATAALATTTTSAPATTATATAATEAPTPATAATSAPSTAASSLEEETRLVRGAAAARKEGDSSRALALLGTHASRFPHGVLERERRAERVFALCDANRAAEARAEAASLLRDNPRGALADRVRASCGAQ